MTSCRHCDCIKNLLLSFILKWHCTSNVCSSEFIRLLLWYQCRKRWGGVRDERTRALEKNRSPKAASLPQRRSWAVWGASCWEWLARGVAVPSGVWVPPSGAVLGKTWNLGLGFRLEPWKDSTQCFPLNFPFHICILLNKNDFLLVYH